MLLAGDLFDSDRLYSQTARTLALTLGRFRGRIFLAPGNHDFYASGSGYSAVEWPENVHIFTSRTPQTVLLPEWNASVTGIAFTTAEEWEPFAGAAFAGSEAAVRLGVVHGEVTRGESKYRAISPAEIGKTDLTYLALGHVHKRTEPLRFGRTTAAWPGCPEGRGFDELGEKGFYAGVLQDGQVTLRFVPLGRHRYWVLPVDVTGRDAAEAAAAALLAGAEGDLCRILLRGESSGVDEKALTQRLAGRCAWLELRDETTLPQDLWQRAEEDSLRGLFLRRLRGQLETAETEAERETIRQAARFGLAALEGRDLS